MKLLIIALYAITTSFLVSVEATFDFELCQEWCEAKGVKNQQKCEDRCVNLRNEEDCKNLCEINRDGFPKRLHICRENCECVDKAAKAMALIKRRQQKVVRMLSQVDSSGEICDEIEGDDSY
eukprot:CAMPEP_0194322946 /NCGR_PEP_ID=MMETSP0171-20130528/23138_1 /TAXON_ID=218684 /ORGANISM="Corethron pennatum, Strain L29A3" /LENGTH=121 /DNA_ID=CAMNT_0039081407 /DNA_START=13 /DNA_END=378 /DNA_ORIENTATION=+